MPLKPELSALVRTHVKSVWTLELLLLMRSRPDHTWSVAELVKELRASTTLVTDALASLERSGLVVGEADGRGRYAPANETLAGLVDAVEAAYRERPVAIINLIAAPEDRLQGLADAFKFRGRDR